ncbi:hypothetical protein C7E25_12215 [Stenotrophomonas maltophilia]|nr:hypothetical protein C7E17_03985 [Stenotrophomonas maltophilia]PSD48094.1 hypothetical protein C7E24_01495 [Stenotrophomonas maltophilia]PSD49499.1 hypothetical protein C7E25_12215 [Stenotrophomonas maltophilia]
MKPQPLASSRMSELQWSEVKRHLPPPLRARVHSREDAYRQFIEAVLWVARGNAPWASIPEEAGPWRAIYVRYVRWAELGYWADVCDGLGVGTPLAEALRAHVQRGRVRSEWRQQRRGTAS